MTTDNSILIVGAGISGLCLGQALLRSQIPFHIYERDAIFNQRAQGYRVRITSVGIAALTACLPPELLSRVKACCAPITKALEDTWNLDGVSGEEIVGPKLGPRGWQTWKRTESGAKSMDLGGQAPQMSEYVEQLNADRTVLRGLLMRGLETYVTFGKEFEGFDTTAGGVKVRFGDGSAVEGALLVGADGAGSRIRKQLVPEFEIVDTEGRFLYGKTLITPELEERMDDRALEGMTVIQDRTRDLILTLFLEPMRFRDNEFRSELPEDYVYWLLAAHKDRYDMDDARLLHLPGEKPANLTQELTCGWHSSFQALFDLQNAAQTSMIRIVSARPDIPAWDSTKNVTLIGDAAHVMPPSAGVGATTALRDAATLSQAFAEEGSQVKKVQKYEGLMRAYAREVLVRSASGGKHMFDMRPFEELKPVPV